jgi:hypothetical protein
VNLAVIRLRESAQRLTGVRDEDLRLIAAALDVFEALADAPNTNRGELAAVEDALRCPRVPVWSCAGLVLAELAVRHVAAQEVFRAFLASPRAAERFQAISHLTDRMPRELLEELLNQGLCDRSTHVRERAAELSARFGITPRGLTSPSRGRTRRCT